MYEAGGQPLNGPCYGHGAGEGTLSVSIPGEVVGSGRPFLVGGRFTMILDYKENLVPTYYYRRLPTVVVRVLLPTLSP